MTCNTNPARGHHEKCAACKFLSVFMKRPIEVIDFGVQGGSRKPKENDAGVGKSLAKDQLAEIPVGDEENPLLVPSDRQDIFIRETWRIIARDDHYVMAKRSKVRNKAKVSALVEEKFQRAASEDAPWGGFGETSSPVTMAFAYARHACTSSRVRSGCAASSSSIAGFWASSSNTKSTAIRVPLTTGFPARIRGSATMRYWYSG